MERAQFKLLNDIIYYCLPYDDKYLKNPFTYI